MVKACMYGLLLLLVTLPLTANAQPPISPGQPPVSGNPFGPASVTVDCDAGRTIAGALTNPSSPLVVTVRGTCNETVVIARDDVTLQADPLTGATVNGPDPNATTITVLGARVVIDGLTVTGGRNGISGAGASRLAIRNCAVQSTGGNGIVFSQGSNGTVDTCTVQNNPRDGVAIITSSAATIINSTVSGNARTGIILSNGASGRIGVNDANAPAGNTISSNGGNGVHVTTHSSAFIGANTISGNGINPASLPFCCRGVFVFGASHAHLLGGNVVTGHVGDGISVLASSLLIGPPGFDFPTTNTISNNSGGGVNGFNGAALDIRNATINGNTGNGVTLSLRSSARMGAGGTVTVNNNTGHGILLTLGGGLFLQPPPVTVTGNGGFGLQCFGSESSFAGNTAGIGANGAGAISPTCTGF